MMLSTLLNRGKRAARRQKRSSLAGHWPSTNVSAEQLELRIVPYVTTGNLWAHPELVTISFMPDGTSINGNSSNLISTFNAKFGSAATWQNQILKAAQVWAQQTNLNFTVVTDNGAGTGSGSFQQGDPGFGDIRVGGYNFGTSTLATAYLPPPIDNYSIAGDITFNSGQTWNIGTTYDVFTVAVHEIGHALGLNHSASSAAVMYSAYNGVDSGLNTDDINGIRNTYSANAARGKDSYDASASNGTFGTATNITSQINTTSKTALIQNRDITTTADLDYYKFTAPTGGTGSMTMVVKSSGLSLLAPKVWVYNGSQTQLATATGTGFQGKTLTLTVNGIVAGQTYYVKVDGADNTALGTGKYALTLNFGTGANPTVPLPNTQTANGNPLSGGGGMAVGGGDHRRGRHDDHHSEGTDVLIPEDDQADPVAKNSKHGGQADSLANLDWDTLLSALHVVLNG